MDNSELKHNQGFPFGSPVPQLEWGQLQGAPACLYLSPIKGTLSSLHRKEQKGDQKRYSHYNSATFSFLESLFYVMEGRSASCPDKLLATAKLN